MLIERRSEAREALVLSFLLPDGGQGTTRDLSTSGVFFETDFGQQQGDLMDLEFTLASGSRCFRFVLSGSVTRTEPRAERLGVAMKLQTTRIEALA
jgi:hypothetical protein